VVENAAREGGRKREKLRASDYRLEKPQAFLPLVLMGPFNVHICC